jgi:ABC-2 type transport system ATP-binding protein
LISPTVAEVAVEGLAKSFADLQVLRSVSFAVEAGESVALLGRNGAGKSTLVRILCGTVLPDRGTVRLHGEPHVGEPSRHVGHVLPDERSWYWRLTGQQNLEFFAALHGLSRAAARARAAVLLERIGLANAAGQRFGEYSSGMRLRLGIARAQIAEPPILMLDEPTRSLDIPARHELWRELRAMAAAGTAILLVTHDVHEAASAAHRCLLLEDGELAELPEHARADELEAAVLERIGSTFS